MSIRKHIAHDWNVICDVCDRKRKRSECILAYGTGDVPEIMSCRDGCADTRHPLNDPPPLIFDGQPVPDARPDATQDNDTYQITITYPSYMTWGKLKNAGQWGRFNNPNTEQNLNGIWTWGTFKKE